MDIRKRIESMRGQMGERLFKWLRMEEVNEVFDALLKRRQGRKLEE